MSAIKSAVSQNNKKVAQATKVATKAANSEILASYETFLQNTPRPTATGPATESKAFKTFKTGNITVTVREKSVTINDDGKFSHAYEVHTEFMSKGFLSAMSELHTLPATQKYTTLEVGFHAYKSDEELSRLVTANYVAIITAAYVGTNPKAQAVKPTEGMVVCNWELGRYKVAQHIVEQPEWHKDESEDVKHTRQTYCKHFGFDMILSGQKIQVAPWLQKAKYNADGTRAMAADNIHGLTEYDEARSTGTIKAYTEGLGMSAEWAASATAARIFASGYKKANDRLYKQGKELVTANPELKDALQTVSISVSGQIVPVTDLMGETLEVHLGHCEGLSVSRIRVTPESVAAIVAMAGRQRFFTLVA